METYQLVHVLECCPKRESLHKISFLTYEICVIFHTIHNKLSSILLGAFLKNSITLNAFPDRCPTQFNRHTPSWRDSSFLVTWIQITTNSIRGCFYKQVVDGTGITANTSPSPLIHTLQVSWYTSLPAHQYYDKLHWSPYHIMQRREAT